MRRLSALFVGVLLGAGLVCFGFNYHLVRANDGWLIVSRSKASLDDAIVDIRSWGFREWQKHPEFTKDMLNGGHGERVKSAVKDGIINEALDRLGLSQEDDSEQVTR